MRTRQVENAVSAGEGDVEALTLRKRLAANSKDLDARILLARLYSRWGLPDLALEHYRMAAAQFPDSAFVALSLAKELRQAGESEEALKSAQAFLAANPGRSWELLSFEGILEDDLGQHARAEAAHRAALALAPERRALHNNLGYNLLLQDRVEAAVDEFRRALEIDPDSRIAHNNLGEALASLPQSAPGPALSEWARTGSSAVAHNNLAAVLIERGRYAEARAQIAIALELRRDFAPALANLKLVAEKDGQPFTMPAARERVNFRKRVASTLGKVLGSDAATSK